MSKNQWINLGILLVAVIVSVILLWDVVHVQKKVASTVSECNSYWQNQLEVYCPNALKDPFAAINKSLNENIFNDPIVEIR